MDIINNESWLKKPRIVCGIMTGTSLDAIDVAISEFESNDGKCACNKTIFKSFPISKDLFALIDDVLNKDVSISQVSLLNTALSYAYADAIRELCIESDFDINTIEAIGVHGQTVWHEPQGVSFGKRKLSHTLQLCSLSALAKELGIAVVGNFRQADIALGGQGAPLVPIFDYHFLKDKNKDVVALNIGGMANISILSRDTSEENLLAFDTGPGNVLLDMMMQKLYNKPYDENGDIAKSGKLIYSVFEKLKKIEFTFEEPPKSTGRELFNLDLLKSIIPNFSMFQKEDIIHTLACFTAWSIAENVKKFANPFCKLVVSGGGVHNEFIMQQLEKELFDADVISISELGINPDAKEAICFAYLAYRTLAGANGNVKSVTGASKNTVLGEVAV